MTFESKMSSNIVTCLSIALRSVRESMEHDSNDRKQEAFCQYLSNVIYICDVLKNQAWQDDLRSLYSVDTLKLFKLSTQCLDRAQDILKDTNNTDIQPIQPQTPTSPIPVPPSSHIPTIQPPQDHSDHCSNQHSISPTPLLPGKQPLPESPSFQRRMQHVEDARRGNSQLLTAYRARMERREKQVTKLRHPRKTDVTTMNLTLFRKMAENIEIAKARDTALHKRKQERQQRLRQEVDRRLGPSSSLTSDDQVKKEFYVKILEFEQETIWPKSLRDQLHARPDDTSLILQVINKILSTNDHPLTIYLKTHQYAIHQQLVTTCEDAKDFLNNITLLETKHRTTQNNMVYDQDINSSSQGNESLTHATEDNIEGCDVIEATTHEREYNFSEEKMSEYRDALERLVKKVQSVLEMIHSLFLLIYEPLSSAIGQDLCLASVETAFFKPIWPFLLNLYRIVNCQREATLTRVFMKNNTCTPESMKVPDRLCLHQCVKDSNDTTLAYQVAIDELRSLTKLRCPLEKLECIVRTNRLIVDCVEDYYEGINKARNSPETVIGCDDLLPILSYVIIHSNLPQLVSECHAMEDFISTDYLMGEEGYSLTTFQTVLAYLESLEY